MQTIKWIVLYIVAIVIGSFVDINILEKLNINIWLSRSIGCLITAIVALVLHRYLFAQKQSKWDNEITRAIKSPFRVYPRQVID